MATKTNVSASYQNLAMDPTIMREVAAASSAANAIGVVIANVPKNSDFTIKFDPGLFTGSLVRRTKTVVVDQSPPAGDFVPSGTPVTVTVVEKSLIPVKSFPGITAVMDKFPNIGALEDDLNKPNDTIALNARNALDKGAAFADLSEADQAAVTNYVANRMGTSVDLAKAAPEIAFLYQL